MTHPLLSDADVPILRVWASTALAGDAHVNFGDCTHYCQPGVPNDWARLFAAMLLRLPALGGVGGTSLLNATPREGTGTL